MNISSCDKCRLRENCTQIVNGYGSTKSGVMLIGEAPGADEDKIGKPFVGQAGKLLDSVLPMLGVIRKNVYITNVVKCRPPKNRQPLEDEVTSCLPYLKKEIKEVDPSTIILLGQTAASALGISGSMSVMNGVTVFSSVLKRKVSICYHPAAVLYNRMLQSNLESCLVSLSDDVIAHYGKDVTRGQMSINDLYLAAKEDFVAIVSDTPGDFKAYDEMVMSTLDAIISYVFYQKYTSATRLQEFHDYLLCGYTHGLDRSNFIASIISRLNQTLILYYAYLSMPETKSLQKALYSRGIKSKEGANKLYKKVGLNVIR